MDASISAAELRKSLLQQLTAARHRRAAQRAFFRGNRLHPGGALRRDPGAGRRMGEDACRERRAWWCIACTATKSARTRPRRLARSTSKAGSKPGAKMGGDLFSKPKGCSTRWVTRERPKIDRIACPWLIRRFIDPGAEFLYVPQPEVKTRCGKESATPYDVADVEFTHVGELCSFDAFVEKFHLRDPALDALATDRARRRYQPAGPRTTGTRPAGDFTWPVAELPGRPRDAGARHGDVRRAVRLVPQQRNRVSFAEALRTWLKIGCLGFGGPAGQIALMHRILVDEKKWVEEQRYLHALNFCMLLPGPEAQKLATYVGWLLHGVRGGLAAGHPVRAAGRAGDARGQPALRARARHPGGRRRAVRHQGGGAGDRGRGADPHRPARAEDAPADRARGARLRRHLLPRSAVSARSWSLAAAIGFFTTQAKPARGLQRRRRAAGGRPALAAAVGLVLWWAPVRSPRSLLGHAARAGGHRPVLLQARGR